MNPPNLHIFWSWVFYLQIMYTILQRSSHRETWRFQNKIPQNRCKIQFFKDRESVVVRHRNWNFKIQIYRLTSKALKHVIILINWILWMKYLIALSLEKRLSIQLIIKKKTRPLAMIMSWTNILKLQCLIFFTTVWKLENFFLILVMSLRNGK